MTLSDLWCFTYPEDGVFESGQALKRRTCVLSSVIWYTTHPNPVNGRRVGSTPWQLHDLTVNTKKMSFMINCLIQAYLRCSNRCPTFACLTLVFFPWSWSTAGPVERCCQGNPSSSLAPWHHSPFSSGHPIGAALPLAPVLASSRHDGA